MRRTPIFEIDTTSGGQVPGFVLRATTTGEPFQEVLA
jgi:hypothetical protein